MSRHSRKIDNTNTTGTGTVSGGLRTLVRFEREDLLVRMTLTDPLNDEASVRLPLDQGTHKVGVNIQEVVVQEFVPPDLKKDPKATGYLVRKLRPEASYFPTSAQMVLLKRLCGKRFSRVANSWPMMTTLFGS
jgi:hypothetical protein